MSHDRIGKAVKNPVEPVGSDIGTDLGVEFEVPYGKDKYGILISHTSMDKLLDTKYAQIMGRVGVISSAFTIELERPDLPLFAWAVSLSLKEDPGYSPSISMGVAIVTMSHVHEHRGTLTATRRTGYAPSWEYVDYEEGPPLANIEDVIVSADERAASQSR